MAMGSERCVWTFGHPDLVISVSGTHSCCARVRFISILQREDTTSSRPSLGKARPAVAVAPEEKDASGTTQKQSSVLRLQNAGHTT